MEHMTGKQRGQSVLSVKVPIVDKKGNITTKECFLQHYLFEAAEALLVDSFSWAFALPTVADYSTT